MLTSVWLIPCPPNILISDGDTCVHFIINHRTQMSQQLHVRMCMSLHPVNEYLLLPRQPLVYVCFVEKQQKFSRGIPDSSTNKTDITELLLKVALNTITSNPNPKLLQLGSHFTNVLTNMHFVCTCYIILVS
jgi:hypothetical protein